MSQNTHRLFQLLHLHRIIEQCLPRIFFFPPIDNNNKENETSVKLKPDQKEQTDF